MIITGLPAKINKILLKIPDVQRYFEALAANPSLVHTEDVDRIVTESIPDDRLREAIIHIGRHNELPPWYEPKSLTNGELAESYNKSTELGWTNLRFLMRVLKAEFMPDNVPSMIRYHRQVALFCRSCGEYKATRMFEFETKDTSYTGNIEFASEHILDPNKTELVVKKKHGRKKQVVRCITCNTSSAKNLQTRHEGPYASARAYLYDPGYIAQLKAEGKHIPRVMGVRVRMKETANAAEKMAYILSGNAPTSVHLDTIRNNREELEQKIDRETLDKIVEHAIYDAAGIRVLTDSLDDCYVIKTWFKEHFPVVREADYTEKGEPGPKSNGYQSIHLTVMGMPTDQFTAPEKIPVDVQIRTTEMDLTAERGSAAWGPDKDRKRLTDHKLLLAITVFRHYLFGRY